MMTRMPGQPMPTAPQFGAKRQAPNQLANAEARYALKMAAQEAGVPVDRALQREFHDVITGQSFTRQELRAEAEELLRWKTQEPTTGQRLNRCA